MKKIDPIERALNAYLELDTDQQEAFRTLLRIAEKHMVLQPPPGTGKTAFTGTKLGRPKGSKNRKFNPAPGREAMADGEMIDLRETNAAATEGL